MQHWIKIKNQSQWVRKTGSINWEINQHNGKLFSVTLWDNKKVQHCFNCGSLKGAKDKAREIYNIWFKEKTK